MLGFLFFSTFIVSLDSLICGFSLSYRQKNSLPIIIGITLTVFAMCLTTNYLTLAFRKYLTEKTTNLGGALLIAIGIFNLFKKDSEIPLQSTLIKQSIISGFAVGLDGAFLNLSLSIMGVNQFYVPVIIAVMHGCMIAIGIAISNTSFIRNSKRFAVIPPLILIVLGLYKLSAFFV